MKRKRIIIIGGLSAGPSAAAKARRLDENAEILLFEKTAHISYATCGIPYALSGKIKTRDKLLVVHPDLLRKRFKVDLYLNEPVIEIDPTDHIVYTNLGQYTYDKLILATGSRAILPPIQGINEFQNWAHAKTIEDFDRVMKRGVLDTSMHITIVGAGLIGLETAENLIDAGKKVTVIELADNVLSNWDEKFATMTETILQSNGIDLRTGVSVKAVDPRTQELLLSNGDRLYTDFMFVGISVKPNTEMLTSKGAEHLPNGALIVDEKMQTSIPDIYAAGDCASIKDQVAQKMGWFPMGTHSNKGGRTAGSQAVGQVANFKGGYGTAIMKLFDHTIARTGMGIKALKANHIDFQSTFIVAATTPSFYPDPKDLFLEIYFEPKTGKLLGAEMIGEFGVDKRVDVLSTAIYAGLTIYDLPNLDLAYAPPYSPAKDPVIVAGYVAQNTQRGWYRALNVLEAEKEINSINPNEITLLDVRNPSELHRAGKIENAINIPLDDLRDRIDEIDERKPVYIYCAKGLRGYLASMILHHNGFEKITNVAGGFTAWNKIVGKVEVLEVPAS
ncbi:FAD-dependent oxidoreductase [Marinoscillum sp. MHG1-6]|uniref:FAD-dependent oxidoreductase n=1 Tax=Marinoscillum sp. MHG1-6 TaxID=2959627 RepID=UPI00215839C5|nr:FAD-dependent oxidoreductase [Marinoscillum sp. MHG1-6]